MENRPIACSEYMPSYGHQNSISARDANRISNTVFDFVKKEYSRHILDHIIPKVNDIIKRDANIPKYRSTIGVYMMYGAEGMEAGIYFRDFGKLNRNLEDFSDTFQFYPMDFDTRQCEMLIEHIKNLLAPYYTGLGYTVSIIKPGSKIDNENVSTLFTLQWDKLQQE